MFNRKIPIRRKCKNGAIKTFYILDFIGEKIGRLLVLKRKTIKGRYYFECVCDCGKKKTVSGANLARGHTMSCGCLIADGVKKRIKHGYSMTIEYKTWHSIMSRCYNPNDDSYKRYKTNGIKVCSGWQNSLESFIKDMGERPLNADSIERIDNKMNYSCGHCEECIKNGWNFNCKWDTWLNQGRNRSTNVYHEYNGEKLIINDWAKKYNIEPPTLFTRIKRGWDFKRALETPTRKQHNNVNKLRN